MSASSGSVHPRHAIRTRVRGLYALANAGESRDPAVLVDAFLAGGCRLIQLRCKGWSPDQVAELARTVLPRTRAAGALLIINDLAEVAAAVGADGVHVGQADMSAEQVRAIVGPQRLIGVSNNTPSELNESLAAADYVAVGPMFATPNLSRPKPVRGLALLREARAMTALPLVAIGGITPERVAAVQSGGADAWAVIRGLCASDDPEAAVRRFTRAEGDAPQS